MQTPLVPRQRVPDLVVPIVGGSTWSLAEQTPQQFTLIVVYRGLHCPICSHYLADLNRKPRPSMNLVSVCWCYRVTMKPEPVKLKRTGSATACPWVITCP